MSTASRDLIERHWRLANARDWAGFAELLHPALQYEVPQTREYIEGADGYVEMFRTWPGDWRATVKQLVAEPHQAVSVIDFQVGGEHMTGITVFVVAGGRIAAVTDYWPDPYDPPPRTTPVLKRRAAAP